PVAWESLPVDDVLSIGLVNESRVLDPGKVLRFLDIMENETCTDTLINPCYNASDSDTFDITKYECNKHFMGVGDYEFYFTVTDLDDNILSLGGVNCSTGISPMDYDYLTNMKRSAVLGDDVVKISFMVWT
ncbi:MAG: hypothetical protein JW778_06780, partial [Candidatus Altiarchaeota archaeon]|nr:hypothetical protein [Candidatus Altiarchaeota archaeon]